MRKLNTFLALGVLLLTSACGKVVNNNDPIGNIDPKQLDKATQQFCSTTQTLQELKDGTDVPFSQLNYRSRIFAFVGEDTSSECIIKNAINVTNSDGTWFSINPLNNCLKNGSVWVVNSQSSGSGQYYSMILIDDPDQRIMTMSGHMALRGTYVSRSLGLKVLVCVNK